MINTITDAGLSQLLEQYKLILSDIQENRNLASYLSDVEAAISEVEKLKEAEGDKPTPGFDKLKNELYFLKYEILERL